MPRSMAATITRGLGLLLPVAAVVLWPAAASPSMPPAAHDDHWVATGPDPGFDGEVHAALQFEGDLVAGGDFKVAGPVPLNHVGRWDGVSWHALGSGLNGPVTRLFPFRDGLVAAGPFNVAGADSAEAVALWQDGTWSALGAGFDSPPAAFAVYNDRLVAGGWFWRPQDAEYNGVEWRYPADKRLGAAMWTGTEWQPMGTAGDRTAPPNPIRALIVYQGKLLASGWFVVGNSFSGKTGYGLAEWNGTAWTLTGPTLDRTTYHNGGFNAFAVYNGLLVAGGLFDRVTYTGGRPPEPMEVTGNSVLTFDGATWSPLGEGFNGCVLSLSVENGVLVAAGTFTRSGTQVLNRVAFWDESTRTWQPLGSGTDGLVRVVAPVGNALYLGGKFTHAGGQESPNLACWRNGTWSAFAASQPAPVIAPIQSFLDDQGILAGFGNGLMIWRDGAWSRPTGESPTAPALPLSYRLDTDWGEMACSDFRIGLDPQGEIVWPTKTWDGSLLTATPIGPDNYPQVVQTYNGRLVAGGFFWTPAVQVLEGDTWQPMDTGLVDGHPDPDGYGPVQTEGWSRVRSLKVVDGVLLAAGDFLVDDGTGARNLAAWDGSHWTSFAPGTNGLIEDLAEYDGDLVAAGWFTEAGGVSAAHVARWDGTAWHAMGSGLDGPVHDLAVYNGRLIAGGLFRKAGPWTAHNVAAWDGTGWNPLGTGTDAEVDAVAEHGGDLFIGGRFIAAGGRTSIHFARWRDGSPVPRFTELEATRTPDGARVRWSAAAVPGDFNGFAVLRDAFGKDPERISPELLDASGEFVDRNAPAGPVTYRLATEAYSGKITPVAAVYVPARPGLVLRLDPARPNPFQGSTRIRFTNPVEGPVELAVIDISGRVVATLEDRTLPPGEFDIVWSGTDAAGRRAAAGLYFFRLGTAEGTRVTKVQKLR